MELEGFELTTDLIGECYIEFIAVIAVELLIGFYVCYGACWPVESLVLLRGCFLQ